MSIVDYGKIECSKGIPLPLMVAKVQAGFPSCADEFIEKTLDLNELMIQHPQATSFVRVEGDSMKDAGISSGDILLVDRALTPACGKIVIAIVNGEFLVKRLKIQENGNILLLSENKNYKPLVIDKDSLELQIWGVVTYVIHKAK